MVSSLRLRLYAALAFVIIVTLAVAGLAFYFPLGGYRDKVATGTLREVALPIYYSFTVFGERPSAQEIGQYLRLQAEQTDLVVLLLDRNGRVINETSSDPDLAGERFDLPPDGAVGFDIEHLYEGVHRTSEGRELLYIAIPLPVGPRGRLLDLRTLVVAIPRDDAQSIIGDLTPRLLLAGAAGLVAAVIASLVVSQSVYAPLQRVTRAVRAVARGDYRQKIPASGPAEIRELARDVNEMTEAVQQSQETLREFLVNVSHELKTPLTSIAGFAQALSDGTIADDEGRERAARVLHAESRRVLHLVEELLDLSRIESGQTRMNLRPVPLNELFAHLRDVFSLRAEETGVAFEVADGALPAVQADEDRLEQVLGNLLDNAFRHTPKGGSVRLDARRNGRRLVDIIVTDTGEGIPAEDLPRVFDRFYRGDASRGGTGLGLAISKQIVLAHGGQIAVECPPEGGARFTVTLPEAAS
jgi:two-component system OmpR family sensor kinase